MEGKGRCLIEAYPNKWREEKRNNREIPSVVAVAYPASIREKGKFCSLSYSHGKWVGPSYNRTLKRFLFCLHRVFAFVVIKSCYYHEPCTQLYRNVFRAMKL
jgi:hypothetical protein